MEKVLKYIENKNSEFISELSEFLKIPSISNNQDNNGDMYRCADWLLFHLRNIGMENVQVYETGGHPVVYAEWLNAGLNKPTILIYGHYDVQPVDPVELWSNPPFEPVIKNDIIYARGSTDDKGQLFIHIKSIEAFLKTDGILPVNVKLLIEGEEEIGSPNIGKFIEDHKNLLKCDYIVISDTSMYTDELPSICYGLRGLAYMEIEVTGPNKDLHSGSFGGAVDNPINALANIIAKLKDEKGKILIDGFYDDVIELSEKERQEFRRLPFDEKKFKAELDIAEVFGEEGYSTEERKSARPTLDCNGIWGGFQGPGAKTVPPSKAYAKISMRLVPDQNPENIEKLFIKYVSKISPASVKVKSYALHSAKSSVTPIDTPAIKAAMKALESGFGKKPVFIREGGSIPIVNTFKDKLEADTILLGFGLPNENAHSPDEHFNLNNFYRGILSVSYYYNELSKINKNNG